MTSRQRHEDVELAIARAQTAVAMAESDDFTTLGTYAIASMLRSAQFFEDYKEVCLDAEVADLRCAICVFEHLDDGESADAAVTVFLEALNRIRGALDKAARKRKSVERLHAKRVDKGAEAVQ